MLEYPHSLTAEEIRDLVGVAPLMLEIGCHDGSDTAKFLRAMPEAIIHCFEPYENPRRRFRESVGTSKRVRLYPVAVCDIDGQVEFYASTGAAGGREDWDYSGSINRPTGHLKRSPEIAFKPPITVEGMRLDTWFEEHSLPKIDFIWADVQGAQRKVIEGGQRALLATRYLYIERHRWPLYQDEPTPDELLRLLPGFNPLAEYARENVLLENRYAK